MDIKGRSVDLGRRLFLKFSGITALAAFTAKARARPVLESLYTTMERANNKTSADAGYVTLFLCGDVMTGRGIDQVLPHPCEPRIYEPFVTDARDYVKLAENVNGSIPQPVDFAYIWGDALAELERIAPDVRIINLETAVTRSNEYWPGKGINYRMHPDNIPCITAAKIDCCTLANNHVLDWGHPGLAETLDTLQRFKLKIAGAGLNSSEAKAPAIMDVPGKGRVLVFSFGTGSSGVTQDWAAGRDRPGVNLLESLSDRAVQQIAKQVRGIKQPGDIVIASIHWGGNWGYVIAEQQITFAHKLIDEANVDVVHGHSSHHPKGIEIYRGKPVIYGCGDLLNDYEGISGYESYRDDLGLMYFPTLDPASGKLVSFNLIPTQIKRFRLNRTSDDDAKWLGRMLNREGQRFGTRVEQNRDNSLTLRWD